MRTCGPHEDVVIMKRFIIIIIIRCCNIASYKLLCLLTFFFVPNCQLKEGSVVCVNGPFSWCASQGGERATDQNKTY